MNSKELAWKLYNLQIGEWFMYEDEKIMRVPGGWKWDGDFIKFDSEFWEYAKSPTDEIIRLTCPKCGHNYVSNKREQFQSNIYYCESCGRSFAEENNAEKSNFKAGFDSRSIILGEPNTDKTGFDGLQSHIDKDIKEGEQ